MEIGRYCIIRTAQAGVFAGTVVMRSGTEARVDNARRLWSWSGAASLSQLSQEGVKNPDQCKFPIEVPWIILTGVIEVLPCTDAAIQSIAKVPVWRV